MSKFTEVTVSTVSDQERNSLLEQESRPKMETPKGSFEIRTSADGGMASMQNNGHRQYMVGEDANGLPDLLATGKNPVTGQRIASESDICDNTLFRLGGIELDAKSAAAGGFLIKNRDGSYSLNEKAEEAQRATEQQKQEERPQVVSVVSPEAQHVLSDMGVGDAGVNQALVGIMEGDLEKLGAKVSKGTGMDPDEAGEVATQVYDHVYNAAAKHVTHTFGVQGEEVFSFLAERLNAEERANLAYRIYLGDSSAFQEAVTIYKKGHR